MTCDEVFDLLLESGKSPDGLEEHLLRCPRCRNLQMVLSPLKSTGEQLDEPKTSTFDVTAPVAEDSVKAARAMAARLNAASEKRAAAGSRAPVSRSWNYLAAFLAGITAALGVAAALRSEPTVSPMNRQSVCLWITRNVDEPKSDDVVLTCVACHLAPSPRR